VFRIVLPGGTEFEQVGKRGTLPEWWPVSTGSALDLRMTDGRLVLQRNDVDEASGIALAPFGRERSCSLSFGLSPTGHVSIVWPQPFDDLIDALPGVGD
jgi:hypothetical protein